MINQLKAYLNAPFFQGTPVAPAPEADVIVKLGPVVSIPGDDMTEIFLDRLAAMGREGKILTAAHEKISNTHPLIAVKIVLAASLGQVSFGRATASLRAYHNTGVAMAPVSL